MPARVKASLHRLPFDPDALLRDLECVCPDCSDTIHVLGPTELLKAIRQYWERNRRQRSCGAIPADVHDISKVES